MLINGRIKLKEIIVEENSKRIDSFISEIEGISRVTAQRLIENDKILVNGKKTKASYKVINGDKITIEYEEPKEIGLQAEDIPIEIIYEDEDIIVVNKPKGMVVHPANGNPNGTLVNALMAICKDSLSGIGGEIRPGIVHRIDKDTSGILVVAKNDKAHIALSEQIKAHKVDKTYIALVKGIVKENTATINMPISRSQNDRKKMAVNKNGKEAVTHFKVIARYDRYTLLEVKIETGRTHQIRVHLSEIGYPIVGDTVYSNGKNEWNENGQFLHAKSLKFVHPITGKEMFFEAKLPAYFEKVLEALEPRKR
jgi:23S rRNA pseudouridine1911/1915/1917 synthase